jgi:hypothetical protein
VRLALKYAKGRTPFRFDRPIDRLRNAAVIVARHDWILKRDPLAGIGHLLIFYGFVVLFIGTAILAFQDDFAGPVLDFHFFENNEELRAAIEDDDFGKWRVFLHPEQRDHATKARNGSFRLSGGAGTGKTVVLVHRARHLARRDPSARIILTPYNRTLAGQLVEQLRLEAQQRTIVVIGDERVVAAQALIQIGKGRRAERRAVLAAHQQSVERTPLETEAVGRLVDGAAAGLERVVTPGQLHEEVEAADGPVDVEHPPAGMGGALGVDPVPFGGPLHPLDGRVDQLSLLRGELGQHVIRPFLL